MSEQTRSVLAVSSSRADYSHLLWVLHECNDAPEIRLQLAVMAAQLDEEFGAAVQEIREDGFHIDATVRCQSGEDSDVGMARTLADASVGLVDVLDRLRPDLLLLIADRYEMLAPASIATALRIPIAHIEGGEVSEGALDDAVRNALTKLSHLHFTPTEQARDRVIAMGEEPWRVHQTGAPSLDHLQRSKLLHGQALDQALGVAVPRDAILVAYHPVTLARDTLREADALFDALGAWAGPLCFCFPNADAGGRELIRRARAFCRNRDNVSLFVNLNPVLYWSLLRRVSAMVGNSSSGIMEAPALQLPVVNVGIRQQGRQRARNVIDSPAYPVQITQALQRVSSAAFVAGLGGMSNPYGDGDAARRIVQVLKTAPLGEALLVKRAQPLVPGCWTIKPMAETENPPLSAILYVPPLVSEIKMLSASRARPVPRLVTKRTVLTLLDADSAHLSQAYYVRNREHLAPWEPLRSDDFFSLPAALERAQTARAQYQQGQSVLFCALDRTEQEMLASCHLSSIQYGCSMCCNLGFSVSAQHQGTGLMYEVASEVVRHAFEHLGLHRVAAGHMPENHRSGALLKRLGFEKVGYARSQIRIAGRWEDHIQLAMINPAEDTH